MKIFRVDDTVGAMKDSVCVHLVSEEIDVTSVADLVHGDKIAKKCVTVVKEERAMV